MRRHQTKSLFETEGPTQPTADHVIRIAFESAADREFDYAVPDHIWPVQLGRRVEAPFGAGNKAAVGFCVEVDIPVAESFASRARGRQLKRVTRIVDEQPLLDAGLMELARWISTYYVCPLGQVLAAMVPAAVKKGIGEKTEKYVHLSVGDDNEGLLAALSGKRQKQVVSYLQERQATEPQAAVSLQQLTQDIGCSQAPVKKLAEKQIVRFTRKTTLKALPAIPEAMILRTEKVVLNEQQDRVLAHFESQIAAEIFGVTLLHGVTDSGKTELYIRTIEAVLRKGKAAIVLLPEIALTAQTIQRFSARFDRIAVMHSGLTASQRNAEWHKTRTGDVDVVIGARSAVFAPLSRLGLIVVDEEHEPSYKQDTAPRYHGRDVAIKRAQLAKAHCVLGSATPSLETLLNCRNKKYYHLARLTKRVMDLPMPEMKLMDMREGLSKHNGVTLISDPLAQRLTETLAKNEQAILLLNRRGYSNFIFCPSCKHTLHCRNCDVTLTFHKAKTTKHPGMRTITGKHLNYGYAICHYCLAQTLVPEKCPLCGKGMAMIGLGSQRLEEELARRLHEARVSRIDSDSMAGKDYYRVMKDFSEGRIDILAGTQMLAKGLHFPNVTVVGIISADTSLYVPDFRANERTFQLITQVAGRTGRSAKKGTVFVQTFLPDQPAIRFALCGDYAGFVEEELKHRKACDLPPYWRPAAVVLRDRSFEKLEAASQRLREKINKIVQQRGLPVKVRGPIPPPISRIQRFHRMQIIIQSPKSDAIQQLFTDLRAAGPIRPKVKVAIDIDPVSLL